MLGLSTCFVWKNLLPQRGIGAGLRCPGAPLVMALAEGLAVYGLITPLQFLSGT